MSRNPTSEEQKPRTITPQPRHTKFSQRVKKVALMEHEKVEIKKQSIKLKMNRLKVSDP